MGALRNVNQEHKESLTLLERFAIWMTDRVGTMGFFLVIVVWTIVWFLWNVLAPYAYRFDPYPGFLLWVFVSNVIQLFFLPLLMVGQNLQARHAELRAESEFETGQKAEREIEVILKQMDQQSQILQKILEKQGKK